VGRGRDIMSIPLWPNEALSELAENENCPTLTPYLIEGEHPLPFCGIQQTMKLLRLRTACCLHKCFLGTKFRTHCMCLKVDDTVWD
jgi:hypothetical protein